MGRKIVDEIDLYNRVKDADKHRGIAMIKKYYKIPMCEAETKYKKWRKEYVTSWTVEPSGKADKFYSMRKLKRGDI